MKTRRQKLLLGIALLLSLLLVYDYLRIAFAILIQGPAISRWRSDHIHLSKERDGFDITFQSYSAQPPAVVDRTLPIPPTIHHIFLGGNTSRNETLAACLASCVSMHPQYEFMFWDDEKAVEFVATEFPEIAKTWNSYRYLIQKADSLRYLILYVHGGKSPQNR